MLTSSMSNLFMQLIFLEIFCQILMNALFANSQFECMRDNRDCYRISEGYFRNITKNYSDINDLDRGMKKNKLFIIPELYHHHLSLCILTSGSNIFFASLSHKRKTKHLYSAQIDVSIMY